MFRTIIAALLVTITTLASSQAPPAAEELTRLLNEFLAGASRNDAAIHDRFWADELIYTSALGVRRGKAELMQGLGSAQPPKPGDARNNYSAEDIRIHQYGDTAIVAFRLINKAEKDGKTEVSKYLNTGTFLKRKGIWQAVAWQATRAAD